MAPLKAKERCPVVRRHKDMFKAPDDRVCLLWTWESSLRMCDPLFIRYNVPSFSHWGSKTFCLFLSNLAPQETRRNNVFATMFPSLARDHVVTSFFYPKMVATQISLKCQGKNNRCYFFFLFRSNMRRTK